MKIEFDIENCKECPFFEEKRMYTADSWEMAFNWYCKKSDDKKIAGYVEWHDEKEIEIPEWCPIKSK